MPDLCQIDEESAGAVTIRRMGPVAYGGAMAADDGAGEFVAGVRAALGELDGTDVAAVGMLTDLSREEIDALGGVPAATRTPRAL